ncbi:STAS domain-containing protein [Streptomyces sp. NPDC058964]|uniref:STAS domain-containing protein n=1 Tax=Streptomyces sp. NPDC058964 TaxID=3346681 RepID=UPI0036B343AE
MPAAHATNVHTTRRDQALHIILRGELDHYDAEDVDAAWEAADLAALATTVVDLAQVTFADSMLLNALLKARRRHDTAGREFILLGPLHPSVSRLLTISGTLEHFTILNSDPCGGRDGGHPHERGHSG